MAFCSGYCMRVMTGRTRATSLPIPAVMLL
jgi:hypothetical protein